MSGSKEKKKRQLERADGIDKATAEAAAAAKMKKKTRNITILVIVILAVLLFIALFINSKFIRRHFTAIEVGDMSFTAAEYSFFYNNFYYDYYTNVQTNNPSYASILLPDSSKPLGSQQYSEDMTWADFFEQYTTEAMQKYVALYTRAQEEGFTLTEEQQLAYEEELNSLNDSAAYYGQTLDEFLDSYYGKGVTYDTVAKCLEIITIADHYEDAYTDSLEYTQEEIDAQYQENKDYYDLYEYRYFLVRAEEVDEDQYGTDEEREAAEQAALDEARAKAEEILAGVETEEDFIEAAREYDPETYADDDATLRAYNGDSLGDIYGTWMREAGRQYGDTYTADITTGTYVVFFIERTDNHYQTVNARRIVITPATVDESEYEDEEDDSAYEEALAAADEEARGKAEDLYQKWIEEGASEEAFGEYAISNSEDSQASNGGLWENIYKGQFNEECDAWVYDEARQPGDHALIHSEESNSYNLMYFVSDGEIYADSLAEQDLRDEAFQAWEDELVANVAINKTWLFALA